MGTSRQGIPHIVIYPTIAHKPKFQLNSFLKASSYQLNEKFFLRLTNFLSILRHTHIFLKCFAPIYRKNFCKRSIVNKSPKKTWQGQHMALLFYYPTFDFCYESAIPKARSEVVISFFNRGKSFSGGLPFLWILRNMQSV